LGNKISEEEHLILKKENKIKIQKIIANVATVADTIPNFISRAKDKGVYVDLRQPIAIYDGQCIHLDKDEVEKMKKQFRINYIKNTKNDNSTSDEKQSIAINKNKNKSESENITQPKPVYVENKSERKEIEHIVKSESDSRDSVDITDDMQIQIEDDITEENSKNESLDGTGETDTSNKDDAIMIQSILMDNDELEEDKDLENDLRIKR